MRWRAACCWRRSAAAWELAARRTTNSKNCSRRSRRDDESRGGRSMNAPFLPRVLRSYQQRAATFLYERDAGLVIAPLGAGKGAAALTALAELIRDGQRRHGLVIAPKLVAETVWPHEVASWPHLQHLRVAVLDGSPERRRPERAGSVPAAPGAALMQPRTAFRLAMLANGYQPLLNDCKRSIEPGWPTRVVDAAEVLTWDRSALTSTGLKIDGDLAVIDVDVGEASLVTALAGALEARFPALFTHGLVRHAGGPKEAWIARVEEPFRRLASRRWYRGSDPDDPAVPKHMVECFGSLGTRQFAIDGPHVRRQGEVISTYQFVGGASPATMSRASLPALPQAAYGLACDLFDNIAAAAGLTAVTGAGRGRDGAMCFELDADTEIETRDNGTMTVAELERLLRARGRHATAPATLRCSGRFHDPTRVRT